MQTVGKRSREIRKTKLVFTKQPHPPHVAVKKAFLLTNTVAENTQRRGTKKYSVKNKAKKTPKI